MSTQHLLASAHVTMTSSWQQQRTGGGRTQWRGFYILMVTLQMRVGCWTGNRPSKSNCSGSSTLLGDACCGCNATARKTTTSISEQYLASRRAQPLDSRHCISAKLLPPLCCRRAAAATGLPPPRCRCRCATTTLPPLSCCVLPPRCPCCHATAKLPPPSCCQAAATAPVAALLLPHCHQAVAPLASLHAPPPLIAPLPRIH